MTKYNPDLSSVISQNSYSIGQVIYVTQGHPEDHYYGVIVAIDYDQPCVCIDDLHCKVSLEDIRSLTVKEKGEE